VWSVKSRSSLGPHSLGLQLHVGVLAEIYRNRPRLTLVEVFLARATTPVQNCLPCSSQ